MIAAMDDSQTDPAPFASLINEPNGLDRVLNGMRKAITLSFKHDLERNESAAARVSATNPSKLEVKRRSDICIKWFRILKGDLHWSLDKAVDFLPVALRNELDGRLWEPPKHVSAWAPEMLHVDPERPR